MTEEEIRFPLPFLSVVLDESGVVAVGARGHLVVAAQSEVKTAVGAGITALTGLFARAKLCVHQRTSLCWY